MAQPCAVLAEATLRMIEGQMMDMAAEREALAINEQNLRALPAGKTGASWSHPWSWAL